MTTKQSVMARDLQAQITELKASLSEAKRTVNAHRKVIARHEELLKFVDEQKSVKHLDALQERIAELSARLQVDILKLSVCSEVSRVHPGIWPFLTKALDRSDEWWSQGDNFTIGKWQTRLIAAGSE